MDLSRGKRWEIVGTKINLYLLHYYYYTSKFDQWSIGPPDAYEEQGRLLFALITLGDLVLRASGISVCYPWFTKLLC
uniref:Uncharacterized protein n=1 Tax=Arundo donax TaxID=35708 RepID=A0A0A8YGN1_ARUDO